LDGLPDIRDEWIVVCDRKGHVSSISGNVMEACGIAAGDITGMNAMDIIQRCLGDDSKYGDSDLTDILKKGENLIKRIEWYTSEGFRKVIDLSLVTLEGEGSGSGLQIVSLKDVTGQCEIEEILERYAQGMTVLYEISAAFLSDKGMHDIMKHVMKMVRSYYEADVVQVLVPAGNGDSRTFELLAVDGPGDEPGSKAVLTEDSIEGNSIIRQCPVVVTDLSSGGEIRRAEFMEGLPVGSGIGVPMTAGESIHGVLSILYSTPRQIDTAELWYLNVLTNILSVFIEKQRSFARIKESESFLNSVLEGIGEGVVVVNPEMKIISANRGYLDIVGLEKEDVIGQSYFKVSIGEEGPVQEDETGSVMNVFETGRPLSSLNSHMDGKGRKLSVQTKSYPIFGFSGEVVAVVETLMDITESIRLERDLEKRVKELEEFYDMAVGRELRMIELKDEIESLRAELSRKS
jgi:PAS domain S-box-containing protein